MKLSWTEKILLNKWGDSKNLSWADQRPYEKLECPGCLLKTREYRNTVHNTNIFDKEAKKSYSF